MHRELLAEEVAESATLPREHKPIMSSNHRIKVARAALAFLTAVVFGLGIVKYESNFAGAKTIKDLGGEVIVDPIFPGQYLGPIVDDVLAIAANRLWHVYLTGQHVDDAALSSLNGFPDATILNLQRTAVTGAFLSRLPRAGRLRDLYLIGSPVNDAGLVNLDRFPGLQNLALS